MGMSHAEYPSLVTCTQGHKMSTSYAHLVSLHAGCVRGSGQAREAVCECVHECEWGRHTSKSENSCEWRKHCHPVMVTYDPLCRGRCPRCPSLCWGSSSHYDSMTVQVGPQNEHMFCGLSCRWRTSEGLNDPLCRGGHPRRPSLCWGSSSDYDTMTVQAGPQNEHIKCLLCGPLCKLGVR